MKTFGKVALLAMTVAMAGVLAACGGSAGSSSAASGSAASASAASSAAASTSASAASSAAASTSAAAASSTSAGGVEAADIYKNEFFRVNFELPEGWSFADEAALTKVNAEIASLAEGGKIDAVAIAGDGSAACMIAVEDANNENAGQTAEAHLQNELNELKVSGDGSTSYETVESAIDFGKERSIPAAITTISVNGSGLAIGQACAETDGSFLDVVVFGADAQTVEGLFSHLQAAE